MTNSVVTPSARDADVWPFPPPGGPEPLDPREAARLQRQQVLRERNARAEEIASLPDAPW